MILRLLFAGMLCVCLCKAKSGGCAALKSCAQQYGESVIIPSFKDFSALSDRDISTMIYDSLCKYEHLFKQCYSGFQQCEFYSDFFQYSMLAGYKMDLEEVCDHKADYISSTLCMMTEVENIADFHITQECVYKINAFKLMSRSASGYCSSLKDAINCSQTLRIAMKCALPLYIKGMPCMDILQGL